MLESIFGLATTHAATVTQSGMVTLDTADTAWISAGLANMAQSFITVWMQLLPYIIPLIAVFLIFGYVKGFVKRKG